MPEKDKRQAVIYARVSDRDKQDHRQMLAILRTWVGSRGWLVVAEFYDKVTGDPARRGGDPPGLARAFERLRELRGSGVLVVTSVDRLVRATLELLQFIARVQQIPAAVCSMEDGADCDTTTDTGELLTFMRGWVARMELRLVRRRTKAVLSERRDRVIRDGGFTSKAGVWRTRLGRPSPPQAKLLTAYALWQSGEQGAAVISQRTGLNESTVRTYLGRWERGEAIPRETPITKDKVGP